MSIASAGNDHRLGANEAPPAILSVFLGDMLTDIFEQIAKGGATGTKQGGILHTGVSVLPQLPRDAGDRNRTSPFAFTGNKFEFRAVSANQSIAFPNICLNLAVAESLDHIAGELERAVKGGEKLEEAVAKLLTRLMKEHKRIVFNGDGYSQEWQDEATRRGLLNLKNTVDALPELVKPEVLKTFDKHKVLNEREVRARYLVAVEQYNKTINIEGQTMAGMANRYILPAALTHQRLTAEAVTATSAAGSDCTEGRKIVAELCALTCEFKRRTETLQHALEHGGDSPEVHAKHFRDKVVPAMSALRETGDKLETMVAHDVWPLPTYREMLFLK
jgi:glutamine synthetase